MVCSGLLGPQSVTVLVTVTALEAAWEARSAAARAEDLMCIFYPSQCKYRVWNMVCGWRGSVRQDGLELGLRLEEIGLEMELEEMNGVLC